MENEAQKYPPHPTDISLAVKKAAEWHAGQKRRYTGEDYIVHPLEVFMLVREAGMRKEAQVAALLHDTIEDCQGDFDIRAGIKSFFGEEVLALVVALTDVPADDPDNRRDRKVRDRIRLQYAGAEVQSIKCADIISNTPSICINDRQFARLYLMEVRATLDVMNDADAELWAKASCIVNDWRGLLAGVGK